MGRRKKKQGDIEDAIEKVNGGAKRGHNSSLTDDERRALTLHHKRLYEEADAKVELAKTGRKAVEDLAKSDLGKKVVADIKDMIAYADEAKLKGNLERALRLARWLGMPVGTQVNLFDAPVDDRAAQEGSTAGMAGADCKPPVHYSAESSQRWIAAWHEGQATLTAAFGKLRGDVKSDAKNTADTKDPPFVPPTEPVPDAPAMPA